ncbi:HlyD family type I secretion periplasmic adaptor subunit [Pleomorphomonas carboxyditropha]|uniref:Membrane fusion protein (MFP) family protein n=1 Tax=Pleomorphomonas carboxyditropha TaxID=2023338 RepID=A0A2G9X1Z0_9HYPH|nr:HlyD family type I secretion periplasmic adaptor subunit [Pleomorphomonas carboxyditropha]PIP00583.1 hemolysin secretion protein D [Pleomorphomonas carboxyditropha]
MSPDTRSHLIRSLRRNLLAGVAGVLMLIGGIGGWAATTELSGAVIATGVLVVEGNAKKVQHPEGGIIDELLVREGQEVLAGEIVVRMDDTSVQAGLSAVEKNILQLLARQARLEAERDGRPDMSPPDALLARLQGEDASVALASERRLFEDRRASRDSQKARLREQIQQLREQIGGVEIQQQAKTKEIELIAKELDGQRSLFAKGLTSLSQVNSLDRSATRLQGERGQLIATTAAARGKIAEIGLQLVQVDQDLRTEVAAELRDVTNQLATLAEDEVTARDRLKHSDVRAPIAGTVHLLAVHTVGGVVTAAETMMEIVPGKDDLTVDARISPQDVDQISVGQPATLRLTAFNRNTTPELAGAVIRVSADLETDRTTGASFYRVGVSIPDEEIARLPVGLSLVPGMPVEAFVTTGNRTVASYLLKPIRDHAGRAFREE